MGGVCLNEGCIPTKTLLYSAKVYDYTRHASKYAVSVSDSSYDLSKIISRKSKVIRKLVLGIKAKLTAQQVTIVSGEAYIANQHTVICGDESYECDYMIVCTGSEHLFHLFKELIKLIIGRTVMLYQIRDSFFIGYCGRRSNRYGVCFIFQQFRGKGYGS